jgi:exopolyphosphatase/guanosine-5'-triphosphate,3'-diphosphate pyrophosphatase
VASATLAVPLGSGGMAAITVPGPRAKSQPSGRAPNPSPKLAAAPAAAANGPASGSAASAADTFGSHAAQDAPPAAVRANGLPLLRDGFVVGAPDMPLPPLMDWADDEVASGRRGGFPAPGPGGGDGAAAPTAQPNEARGRPPRPKEVRPGGPRPYRSGDPHRPGDMHRTGDTHRTNDPRRFGRDLYAALDLGTNNCRLLIAEPQRAGFRVIDAFSRIVRLGEGISTSRRLSDAAQDRAVEALKICKAKLELRGVSRARLVATEACRIAENGESFLDRVEQEAGLRLEIVSRETEARLAVAGCASLVDWQSDGVILFDIGGGSSELVWLDLDRKSGQGDLTRHIRAWTSLPVGVVTLSERHGGVVVDRDVFEDMVDHVDALLDALSDQVELGAALAAGRFHMLGTSGTVTTLAGVHLGLRRYDRRRVDGLWLADEDVSTLIDRLIDMDYAERVSNPCIGSDRADLVLAGCAILEAIRRRWPCERLRVADRGLREGILTELMVADGVWRRDGGRS